MKHKQLILPAIILLAIFGYFIYGSLNSSKRVSDAEYLDDKKISMTVNNKPFKLSYPKELQAFHRDSLEWTVKMQSTQDNGALYVIADKGKSPTLSTPYILVGYFNKTQKMENKTEKRQSMSDIQAGIDKMLGMIPDSKVLKPLHKEPTISAVEANCEELFLGKRQVGEQSFIEKYVAYAFIEHDKDFWISISFTSPTKTEFDDRIKMFYQVVRSYQN